MSDSKVPILSEYSLLGRSGLRVSPLSLGTMTFGTEWGWGSPEETAGAILDRYLDAGGNFIDTANGYTNGKSEELVGKFLNLIPRHGIFGLLDLWRNLSPGTTKNS